MTISQIISRCGQLVAPAGVQDADKEQALSQAKISDTPVVISPATPSVGMLRTARKTGYGVHTVKGGYPVLP